MPGGTNLPVLLSLGCGSQMPYPYDAYPHDLLFNGNRSRRDRQVGGAMPCQLTMTRLLSGEDYKQRANRAFMRDPRHRSILPLLLLTLACGPLPALVWIGEALADERVLKVKNGAELRRYPVKDLIDAIGLTELRVANDPHFGPDRVFAGFALKPLLSQIGMGDATELLLVCSDGYSIPFDTELLSEPALQGLLAIRDTAMPANAETRWAAFREGGQLVDFDPFYLVWTSSDESIDLGTEVIPWPFQLTEIQRLDQKSYFAPARPPTDADDAVKKGFASYQAHCAKCHRMRGLGGDVGPALDREGGLSSVLDAAQLRDYVEHDEKSFSQSRMPRFSMLLSAREIDQIVAYLRAMQSPH